MKSLKFLTVGIIALVVSIGVNAQDHSMKMSTKTESFKVSGKCGMCKTRIEKAAKIEGVTKAEWDADKQLLTVTYMPDMVKIDDIQKKIAAVGHDTEKFMSDDKVYDKLPGCCKYRK
jgi:copper chaperone CopZ